MALTLKSVPLKSVLLQGIPIGIVLSLLAVSLTLIQIATNNPHRASSISHWLIPLNGLILVILSGLIIYNLVKLVSRLRARQAGSRHTARLVTAFSILTTLPVLIITFFSMNFLGDRIDTWFDVKIEGALEDSLELSRRALDVRMRQHLFNLEQVAKEMVAENPRDPRDYAPFIDQKREMIGADEMVLFGSNNRIIVYSGDDTDTILPHFPTDEIFRTLTTLGYMYQLEPDIEDDLYSRVALTMQATVASETLVLTALFPFSETESRLAENVLLAQRQYQTTSYTRNEIKTSFRLTLLLIMILSILFALLAAFIYSQKLTEPISKLLEGTVAVASGNLYKKLPVSEKDDFSLLARSFNTMTSRLAEARKESETSQRQLQQQRDYLNIVLNHINSGVMTIDENGVIRRINTAAEQVLQTSLNQYIGRTCEDMCNEIEGFRPLFDAIQPHVESNDKDWSLELGLLLPSGRQTLVCRGAKLPSLIDGEQGHVIVLDDITEVIQAEHEAAWSEVARRLAHEIKNPLTPIQLSAERIQRKLLPELAEDSADLLKRMSSTIISQVDNMKTMVDAFSQYARAPALKFHKMNINKLVQEVAELYRMNSQHAKIVLALEEVTDLYLDEHRIRQMLVNLLKNALEALPDDQTKKQVTISTWHNTQAGDICVDHIMLEITDNGSGIAEELINDLFTPYVSNKSSGTGLGLSIVKKIVEEHSGKVFARNNETKGATMSICLPINKLSIASVS